MLGVTITLAFIYIPLFVVAIYAFNGDSTLAWPPSDLTTHWFGVAIHNQGAQDALVTSLKVGAAATAIALLLGTLAALRGRPLRVLRPRDDLVPRHPADRAAGNRHRDRALEHVHAGARDQPRAVHGRRRARDFCIVLVYNNVVARLRRVSGSFEEASADLGAHTWQTFRFITLPNMQTALVAGALLAFALSFDEIIVTTFTLGAGAETLPIWIFSNLFRPNQIPIVNVVALLVVLISIIPVYLAHRLTRDEGAGAAPAGGAPAGGAAGEPVAAEATAMP